MTMDFQDLLEPIEVIEPLGLPAEFNIPLSDIIIKCRAPGYICKTGETIP